MSDMDHKTLQALKESIVKWDRNAEATCASDAHVYGDTCALCTVHYMDNCSGCPVAEAVNDTECNNSPWEVAIDEYLAWKCHDRHAPAFRAAAKAEADFLRSLLPEGETV